MGGVDNRGGAGRRGSSRRRRERTERPMEVRGAVLREREGGGGDRGCQGRGPGRVSTGENSVRTPKDGGEGKQERVLISPIARDQKCGLAKSIKAWQHILFVAYSLIRCHAPKVALTPAWQSSWK
uniref:Uncharacterized protein n=1 Tax=Arundo donax TaxID=35708 RepID=A0A0A9EBF9_ARUDO